MKVPAIRLLSAALIVGLVVPNVSGQSPTPLRKTLVSIVGDQFYLNGEPTYQGRTWNGHKLEGLLLNSRMVQGIFDDLNAETVNRWAYPDTGVWDAERNTREFIAAMPAWRAHGLLAFTINLQGGSVTDTKGNFFFANAMPGRLDLIRAIPMGTGGGYTHGPQTWFICQPGITNDLGNVTYDSPPPPPLLEKVKRSLGL